MLVHGILPLIGGALDFDTSKGMFRLMPNGEVLRFDTYTETFHHICPQDYAAEIDAITMKAVAFAAN